MAAPSSARRLISASQPSGFRDALCDRLRLARGTSIAELRAAIQQLPPTPRPRVRQAASQTQRLSVAARRKAATARRQSAEDALYEKWQGRRA